MDDNGTEDAWPAFVRRYAQVVRAAAVSLDENGWALAFKAECRGLLDEIQGCDRKHLREGHDPNDYDLDDELPKLAFLEDYVWAKGCTYSEAQDRFNDIVLDTIASVTEGARQCP